MLPDVLPQRAWLTLAADMESATPMASEYEKHEEAWQLEGCAFEAELDAELEFESLDVPEIDFWSHKVHVR